jgi:hypothetical protein
MISAMQKIRRRLPTRCMGPAKGSRPELDGRQCDESIAMPVNKTVEIKFALPQANHENSGDTISNLLTVRARPVTNFANPSRTTSPGAKPATRYYRIPL